MSHCTKFITVDWGGHADKQWTLSPYSFPTTQPHASRCTCVHFSPVSWTMSSSCVCCTCQVCSTLYLPVSAVAFFVVTIKFSPLSSLAIKANTELSQNQRSHLKIILWADVLSFLLLCLHLSITLDKVFLKILKWFQGFKVNLQLTWGQKLGGLMYN